MSYHLEKEEYLLAAMEVRKGARDILRRSTCWLLEVAGTWDPLVILRRRTDYLLDANC